MQLRKYEPVQSRFNGKRGTLAKIEHDEFYNCLMYLVTFEPQMNEATGKHDEYQQWWYKAQNLTDPGSKDRIPYPYYNEKEPRDKKRA